MADISIVSLFCEDIREEKQNTDSLMGIMPDNLNVPGPGAIPRMALYTRIHLNPAFDPGRIHIRIVQANGEEVSLGDIEPHLVKKARDDAVAAGVPIAGVISRAVFGNFPIKAEGVVRAIVLAAGTETISAMLNVKFIGAASAPSASAPQPAQSPAAVLASKP